MSTRRMQVPREFGRGGKPLKPWYRKPRFVLPMFVAGVAVLAMAFPSESDQSTGGGSVTKAPATTSAKAVVGSKVAQASKDGTVSQQNALRSAEHYIKYQAFSRKGLIKQLSSDYGEGFSVADATWAVSQLDVNWKEQAVRSGKSYLDMQGFSRKGLIDQLSSSAGENFTRAQAMYAADQLGLK